MSAIRKLHPESPKTQVRGTGRGVTTEQGARTGRRVMIQQPATREEIAALARNAGLDLPQDLFDELVEAYRHVEPMLMRLRRGRRHADEPAHVFDPRKFTPGQS
jgi:hydrogenase maturation factor